jgi:hypothetical protein
MSERRGSPRCKFQTPVAFRRLGQLFDDERIVRSIDMPTGSLRFATGVRVTVRECIERSVLAPKQIARDKQRYRRFTGRVAGVDSRNLHSSAREGVQWLYLETAVPERGSARAPWSKPQPYVRPQLGPES